MAVVEKYTLDGANTNTLMKHKHKGHTHESHNNIRLKILAGYNNHKCLTLARTRWKEAYSTNYRKMSTFYYWLDIFWSVDTTLSFMAIIFVGFDSETKFSNYFNFTWSLLLLISTNVDLHIHFLLILLKVDRDQRLYAMSSRPRGGASGFHVKNKYGTVFPKHMLIIYTDFNKSFRL